MRNTKHTPGEWAVAMNGQQVWSNNIATICTIEAREGQQLANAKLIAAAPELLQSVKEFIEFWERSNYNEDSDLYKYAKAAIKKATE